MKKQRRLIAAVLLMLAALGTVQAREWSLKECIDYALQNNITLQKSRLSVKSAQEDLLQSRAGLLPSLSASTNQNLNYRPWIESAAGGGAPSSVDKVYYNGSYSLSANWTVWNGNRNRNTIKRNRLLTELAEAQTEVSAATIQEQIAQLYVQILYSAEALRVSEQSLNTSQTNEDRGREMLRVGKMSRADLAQLTAQRAQEEYNLVAAQSTLADYKRQLKQLLQITDGEVFDVVVPPSTDEMALQPIPSVNNVYLAAVECRPELKAAQLALAGSDVNIKIARALRLPTVSLGGAFSTNTSSTSDNAWGTQLKTHLDMGAGLTVSIPLFDNRTQRTALNKALIERQGYLLDLKDRQTALYANIENYWLQATTHQSKFKAARESVKSAQESFDLLSEQFRLGLKNIIQLMTGKNNLVAAQQNALQSKYLAILNLDLLQFYQTGKMR